MLCLTCRPLEFAVVFERTDHAWVKKIIDIILLTLSLHVQGDVGSTGPGTTPGGMLETSEGLPPPPTAPALRPLIMSLRTGPLAADELAGGFPC